MKLNRDEMKKILGGLTDPGSGEECRTTCKSGRDAVITDCQGICIEQVDSYVKCSSPYQKVECENFSS
jgi:hypothetical protein